MHGLQQCSRSIERRALLLPRFSGSPVIPARRTAPLRRTYASVLAAELQFGQPVHETHPHLLKPGEITPGITALEYAERRSKLAARLPKNAIAVVAASEIQYRSGAVFYEFHQDSNFFYLTGFNEPEALAIIEKSAPGDDHTFHLYVRPKDPKAEQWDGARSGTQAAVDVFNADETGDVNNLHNLLGPVIRAASEVYTDISLKPSPKSTFSRFFSNPSAKSEVMAKVLESSKVKPLKPVINDIRAYKSEAEITNMRRAGQASGRAFTEAMRQPWTREKDLAAFLDYRFKIQGCDTSAYVPVVAGGQNALSIHYVRNDDILRNEDLVLTDAGGSYGGYITDITRTFPTSGAFTPAQKDLYTAILSVQRTSISLCRASARLSLDALHSIAEQGLREQLQRLGFDMGGQALEALFPHQLGHYIGLDVHDTPGYSRKGALREGQCVTVEPGVYVPDDERWPEHFRGLGIRIEDSVCVGEENPLVLTTEAVKEVVDIEALRN
ncbi:xaa-pro aminopeptidase [Lasallia pustulata]|uniref:Xaa-Pro aminopeptidase n=1 Tax=Lasallia pustulata TaxID=136370 RepID=A0A1W5D1P5_9LECA|nr:xaa-pro aminopeptidase [Lasallia pustulata]